MCRAVPFPRHQAGRVRQRVGVRIMDLEVDAAPAQAPGGVDPGWIFTPIDCAARRKKRACGRPGNQSPVTGTGLRAFRTRPASHRPQSRRAAFELRPVDLDDPVTARPCGGGCPARSEISTARFLAAENGRRRRRRRASRASLLARVKRPKNPRGHSSAMKAVRNFSLNESARGA